MLVAPFVGLLLGVIAAIALVVGQWLYGFSSLLAPGLAVGTLAFLTRGLHLDGLADLADGLGSGKPEEQALQIMKRSDIGPFGVVTLVFTLLIQVTGLAQMPASGGLALVTACVTGRLAVTWACREGVPAARPDGLGALVAGTVRRGAALATTLTAAVVMACLAALVMLVQLQASSLPLAAAVGEFLGLDLGSELGLDVGSGNAATDPGAAATAIWIGTGSGTGAMYFAQFLRCVLPPIVVCPLAMAVGLGAAAMLRRRATRRLGGITGDVLGALVEAATTVTLLACALVLP